MKVSKIIKLILVSLILFLAVQFLPNNKVEAATKLDLKVSYSYDEQKDVVTVTVKSNVKLKKTKPSWTLSKDKKTYTKKFYANQKYSTIFTAQNGKSKSVNIKVNQIKGPQITVSYKYDKTKNTVTVTAKSNKQFQDTKPTWTLSKNKKTYTKTFSKNETYKTLFYDKYGNKKNIRVKVTQIDKEGPAINISYKYNEEDNNVLVTVKSNEELKHTNTSWTLSDDKKTYTKIYKKNITRTISFYDKYNNKTTTKLNVTEIDEGGPQINVTYKYNSNKTSVVVTLTSEEELLDSLVNDGWKLSSDQKVYTKTFKKNTSTSITVKDKYNNATITKISITKLIYKGIDVSAHNDKIDWEKVKKAGVEFAILRCGFGKDVTSQDDKTFRYNIEECKRLSIPYGVYLYSYALTVKDAKSEASHVLRLVKDYNPKYGIWFDMEDADGYKKKNGMPSNETLVNICYTFCEEIKNNGYKNVGIYASLSWLNNQLNSTKLDKYQKWVAQWNSKCTYVKDYAMWQYTSDGTVDGIIGRVDMDYYYKK